MLSIVTILLFFTPSLAQIQGPISPDFQQWLAANGYSQYNFARTDLGNYGSYGGKTADDQSVSTVYSCTAVLLYIIFWFLFQTSNKSAVIFVHGNSDQALRNPSCSGMYCKYQTGWDNSIQYF